MSRKEIALKKIEEGINVYYLKSFFHDEDIKSAALKKDPENWIYFHDYSNDKELILTKVITKDIALLENMSIQLKEDIPFAIELLEKTPKAMQYFSEEVKYSPEVMNIVLKNVSMYFSELYVDYIYENYKENFLEIFNKFPAFYSKLPEYLQNNKELVLLKYKNDEANPNRFPVNYFVLDNNLQQDFEIIVCAFNQISKNKDYMRIVLLYMHESIKIDSNLQALLSKYNNTLCKEIIGVLLLNENFKKDFDEVYKNNPNLDDYRSLLNEVNLKKKIDASNKTIEHVSKRPKV